MLFFWDIFGAFLAAFRYYFFCYRTQSALWNTVCIFLLFATLARCWSACCSVFGFVVLLSTVMLKNEVWGSSFPPLCSVHQFHRQRDVLRAWCYHHHAWDLVQLLCFLSCSPSEAFSLWWDASVKSSLNVSVLEHILSFLEGNLFQQLPVQGRTLP